MLTAAVCGTYTRYTLHVRQIDIHSNKVAIKLKMLKRWLYIFALKSCMAGQNHWYSLKTFDIAGTSLFCFEHMLYDTRSIRLENTISLSFSTFFSSLQFSHSIRFKLMYRLCIWYEKLLYWVFIVAELISLSYNVQQSSRRARVHCFRFPYPHEVISTRDLKRCNCMQSVAYWTLYNQHTPSSVVRKYKQLHL